MDNVAAEKLARDYAGKLFFGQTKALWHFVTSDENGFRLCAHEKRLPKLSLEDALEVHLYAKAKQEHGVSLFVTADDGIITYSEAIHPERVVADYAHLFR